MSGRSAGIFVVTMLIMVDFVVQRARSRPIFSVGTKVFMFLAAAALFAEGRVAADVMRIVRPMTGPLVLASAVFFVIDRYRRSKER